MSLLEKSSIDINQSEQEKEYNRNMRYENQRLINESYVPSDQEITDAYNAKIAAGYDPKDLPNPKVPTDEEITKAIVER